MFKLQPIDILINVNKRNDYLSRTKRWLLESPFDHVFMYLGNTWIGDGPKPVPLIFESDGRGCQLKVIYDRIGQDVVVLRPYNHEKQEYILWEAIKLASDLQSYDYLCIVQFLIPQAILHKLGLDKLIPLSWQRDKRMICSEAVFEAYYRGGVEDILPDSIGLILSTSKHANVPLPGDFLYSPVLELVEEGKLSEEWL